MNQRQSIPRWAEYVLTFNSYFTENLFGGVKPLKLAWAINLHKALTPFFVFLLMVYYGQFGLGAWVYLALHGTYCMCWLLKHAAFPDRQWERRTTIGGGIFTFLLLATYWVAPYLLISNVMHRGTLELPASLVAGSICLCIFGVAVMMGSDCQKYFTLKHRPGLITEGLFKYVRHPNYTGEMLIYVGLALLVQHWIPWLVLLYWWMGVFLVNVLKIEASLSRYPEWTRYQSSTGMFLPRLVRHRG
jgi:protein-S-isoprenylcysteine O-methyltransferase Ste14